MRRVFALCLCGLCLSALAAGAADQRALNSLKELDFEERQEQRCDLEAMEQIARNKAGYRPDKVIAYTFADPDVKGDRMTATGAAFRSKGEWYRLNYDCRTGPEHLTIKSFDYHIGAMVPKSEWATHYLAAD